jgi:hypothetical protein
VRKQNKNAVDSGNRNWRIKGGEPYQGVNADTWHLTIADVRLNDPQSYCEDVNIWAKDVLARVMKTGE